MNKCEHKWDGPTVVTKNGSKSCASCSLCGVSFHDYWDNLPKGMTQKTTYVPYSTPQTKLYHFWVGKYGYSITSTKDRPHHGRKNKVKMSYMGTSSDEGWPKRMSTGRLMFKPPEKLKTKKLSRGLKN